MVFLQFYINVSKKKKINSHKYCEKVEGIYCDLSPTRWLTMLVQDVQTLINTLKLPCTKIINCNIHLSNLASLAYALKTLHKNALKIFFKGYSNKKTVNEVK